MKSIEAQLKDLIIDGMYDEDDIDEALNLLNSIIRKNKRLEEEIIDLYEELDGEYM